jgi:hypothetical protein
VQAESTGAAAVRLDVQSPASSGVQRERRGPLSSVLRELPRRYFEEGAAIGRAVFEASPGEARLYRVGGLTCRIRYSDERVMLALHRALSHLEIRSSPRVELDIGVWDARRAEPQLPALHPQLGLRNHRIELCSDARFVALHEPWVGFTSYVDRNAGEAWHAVWGSEVLPHYERAAPLRGVFNALLVARRMQLVHAAAVGTPRGGVLLVGPAGAGKSSSAFSCLGTGLGYIADSWCCVGAADAPRLFSLYSTAKLRSTGLERFPEVVGKIDGVDAIDDGKATLFLAEHFREHLLLEAPARAMLVAEVTANRSTVIVPVPGKKAWHALLSSTLTYLPGWGRESAELIGSVCARLPAFRLQLGSDREGVHAAIAAFLRSA